MLKIDHVTKRFTENKNILEDICLDIPDGEFICLVGHSGCGKSTLLNIIAGLDAPSFGCVMLDGEIISKPGTDRSYLFQNHALFPWLSVIDNVKFGMKMNGISKENQIKKAEHYLEMVKLIEYRDYRIHQLSGGMRQRVALARALTLDSKILLMDEPFASLDSHTKSELRTHLSAIWQETGKTILFVTHDIEEAFILADRVILFSSNPATVIREYYPRGKTSGELTEYRTEIETALADKANGVSYIAS